MSDLLHCLDLDRGERRPLRAILAGESVEPPGTPGSRSRSRWSPSRPRRWRCGRPPGTSGPGVQPHVGVRVLHRAAKTGMPRRPRSPRVSGVSAPAFAFEHVSASGPRKHPHGFALREQAGQHASPSLLPRRWSTTGQRQDGASTSNPIYSDLDSFGLPPGERHIQPCKDRDDSGSLDHFPNDRLNKGTGSLCTKPDDPSTLCSWFHSAKALSRPLPKEEQWPSESSLFAMCAGLRRPKR